MKCEEVREDLADYLAGVATGARKTRVEQHLAGCVDCRADAGLWESLGALPAAGPGPDLRRRFDALIAAQTRPAPVERRRDWLDLLWPWRPAFGLAAAALLVAIGFLGGSRSHSSGGEIAEIRQELRQTRAMVALSLLEQQSAIERLRGVNYTVNLEPGNLQVATALVNTVRSDPSVNVRLAAVDALRGFAAADPALRQDLIEATRKNAQAPLVQIALIDLLVDLKETQSRPLLEQLRQDSSLDESVRQRAEWGLEKLG